MSIIDVLVGSKFDTEYKYEEIPPLNPGSEEEYQIFAVLPSTETDVIEALDAINNLHISTFLLPAATIKAVSRKSLVAFRFAPFLNSKLQISMQP